MKRILSFLMAATLVLSLAACGGNNSQPDNTNGKPENTNNSTAPSKEIEMTAQEVLDALKGKLGDSYASDTVETEDRMSGYYGLDMSKVESWAAESNSMSSMNMDCTVILKVRDGYSQDAAALLQKAFDQTASYAQMYQMDLHRVLQARLFVNGNYVALIIEGQQGDWEASQEDQAKFAAEEAAKADAAWKDIFGTAPTNIITIPEAKEDSGFDMSDFDPDLGPVIGG